MAFTQDLDYRTYMSYMPNYLVPRGSSEAARRIRCQKDGDALAVALGLVTQEALDSGRAPTNRYYGYKDNPQRGNTEFKYCSDTDSDAPLSPPRSPSPVHRDLTKAGWMKSADPLMVKDPALYNMLGFEVYENWKSYVLAKRPWPPVAPRVSIQKKRSTSESRRKTHTQYRLTTPASPKRTTRSQSGSSTVFYELTEDGRYSQESRDTIQRSTKRKVKNLANHSKSSYRVKKKRR